MRTRTLAIAAAIAAVPCLAQVSTDGSAGARATLVGPRYGIAETLGTRVGRNLIHSFSVFNIRSGEQATFTGFSVVDNIIARVTGGTPSTIDGLLKVEMPGANLFLVNPSGLVFGPGAAIDVPAAFYASTAQSIRFADGNVVDMRTASPVSLTAAAPSAFGFESAGAAIVLGGAQLRTREGSRIALVGGDVTLARSTAGRVSVVSAPSGAVDVVATRGEGSVAIGERLDPSGFAAMGNVTISGNSVLSASEGAGRRGGGTVFVRGGDVTLDHGIVESRTRFSNARGIDIGATGRLSIDASNVIAITTGQGNAGYLRLAGRDVAISGGSLVDTSCDPGCTTGRGGDLSITAGNGLTITGNNPNLPTFVVSNSFGGGATGPIFITTGGALTMNGTAYIQGIALAAGSGSSITLRTGSIDLSGGAQVDASTRAGGRGGSIVVENRGDIRVTGGRADPTQGGIKVPSGLFVNAGGAGNAGSLVISTATLQVLDGGEVSSSSQRGATGAGGRIEVRASGLVRVAGVDADRKSSGIVANTFSSGAAGAIDIEAGRVEVADQGRIQTQSEGSGAANTVRIRTGELSLTAGGQVSSDARAGGAGGAVEIDVAERLFITGSDSGVFASTYASAQGGTVRIAAGDVEIDRGGGIFTQSFGTGAAGSLDVSALRSVVIRDSGGERQGGISAAARGVQSSTSRAGSVTIRAGDSIVVENTRSGFGGVGTGARSLDGGDVNLIAGRLIYLNGSSAEAAVIGVGSLGTGGNLTLDSPTVVLQGSDISANAFGGPGGNIRIKSAALFKSANSSITASSQLNVDGTITLDSPALDPTGELLAPAPVFLDVGAVLAGRCGPRLAGRASSLVVLPRAAEGRYPDEMRPALDGRPVGFLTRPAPEACAPEAPAKIAQVAR